LTQIKIKRGAKASIPALAAGELCFASDKHLLAVGTDNTVGGNEIVGRRFIQVANEAAWTALGSARDADTVYWWPS